MCGRYSLTAPGQALAEHFRLPAPPALPLRYNVAPTQPVAVARLGTGSREREAKGDIHLLTLTRVDKLIIPFCDQNTPFLTTQTVPGW